MDVMSQFARSLEESIRLAQALETLLLEETRAIETRDPAYLQRIVADKQCLVTQLEEETRRQREWVEQARYPFTPEGLAQYLAALDRDGRLTGRWSILRESATRCDQMNRTNARLIERARQRTALSLRILNGDDGTASTYDPHGRTESGGTRSRSISQA